MTAARRLLPILLFIVLPVAVAIGMFATASSSNSLAADFHNELYPEAKLLLHWTNPFPGPDAPLEHGHNLIWPPLAAFVVSPSDRAPRERGELGHRPDRRRVLAPLAADRRRPRLARLRRVRAVAAGDRRDPGLASHAVPLRPARPRLAPPRRRASRRASRSASPARSSSSSGRSGSGSPRSDGRARRSSPHSSPAPRSFSSCRSPASTTTCAPSSRSGRTSTRTATPRSASLCRSGSARRAARVVLPARGGAARRVLATGEPRARGRRGARPLADRLARLLRGRGDPPRDRPAEAVALSGSRRSRRGGC